MNETNAIITIAEALAAGEAAPWSMEMMDDKTADLRAAVALAAGLAAQRVADALAGALNDDTHYLRCKTVGFEGRGYRSSSVHPDEAPELWQAAIDLLASARAVDAVESGLRETLTAAADDVADAGDLPDELRTSSDDLIDAIREARNEASGTADAVLDSPGAEDALEAAGYTGSELAGWKS